VEVGHNIKEGTKNAVYNAADKVEEKANQVKHSTK